MDLSRKQETVDFIRDYFYTSPGASIDSCAKALSHEKLPIEMAVISSIRRQVRQSGNYVRPPALVLVSAQPVVQAKVPAVIQAEQEQTTTATKGELLQRRRAYLNKIVEANPRITPTEAIQAVKTKFGHGTDPQYTIQTINVARELQGIPLKKDLRGAAKTAKAVVSKVVPPKSLPTRTVIRPTMAKSPIPVKPKNVFTAPATRAPEAKALAYKPPAEPFRREISSSVQEGESALRTLSWKPPGASVQAWEMVGVGEVKKRINELVARGVDQATIQLWKPVPMKLKIEIDLGD